MESPTRKWLEDWFLKRLGDSVPEQGLKGDVNFFEAGYIDSMGIVSLILDIEAEFGISFTHDHYQDRRFSFIAGLAEIIDSMAASKGKGGSQ